MTAAAEREILLVGDVAELLQCSKAHVCKLLAGSLGLPKIPAVKAGRLWLIRRERLMRWMEEQEGE